jgi:tetratricopeptide (TPR) repeat protein
MVIDRKREKKLRREIEKYRKAVLENPKSRLFAALSDSLRIVGDVKEAISVAERGLEIHPEYMGGIVALAKAVKINKEYERAIVLFEKAIKINPENVSAQRELAEIYDSIGDHEKSMNTYKTIMVLDPTDKNANERYNILEATAPVKKAEVKEEKIEVEEEEKTQIIEKVLEEKVEEEIIEVPAAEDSMTEVIAEVDQTQNGIEKVNATEPKEEEPDINDDEKPEDDTPVINAIISDWEKLDAFFSGADKKSGPVIEDEENIDKRQEKDKVDNVLAHIENQSVIDDNGNNTNKSGIKENSNNEEKIEEESFFVPPKQVIEEVVETDTKAVIDSEEEKSNKNVPEIEKINVLKSYLDRMRNQKEK